MFAFSAIWGYFDELPLFYCNFFVVFLPPPFLAPQSAISTSLSSYLASLTDRPDLKSGNNYALLLGSSHRTCKLFGRSHFWNSRFILLFERAYAYFSQLSGRKKTYITCGFFRALDNKNLQTSPLWAFIYIINNSSFTGRIEDFRYCNCFVSF